MNQLFRLKVANFNFTANPTGATTSMEYSLGQDMPDTKEGIEELCPVCGDKVSGYHYGLLTVSGFQL